MGRWVLYPETTRMSTESPKHHEVRIAVDEVRDGVPYRKCPKCRKMKSLDDFGLRKHSSLNAEGQEIMANQSWCRGCR